MSKRIEKKCPYCGKKYSGNTIRVPGVYWGHYYDMIDFLKTNGCKLSEDYRKSYNKIDHKCIYRPAPPDILYHYTSFFKLRAILNPSSDSFSLWAGHYSKMNDWKEVAIGIELLRKYLHNYKRSADKKRLFDQIVEIEQQKKSCFIFSLTEEKDILSQWRAYTSLEEGGVALGFDATKLKLDNIALVPCSYTNRYREIDLNNIFQMAKYRASNKGKDAIELQIKEDDRLTEFLLSRGGKLTPVEYQLEDLLEVATTIKDFGFFEEKEWRLIIIEPDTLFSSNDYYKIPFVPQTWIKEVVISPHGNVDIIYNYINWLIHKGILSSDCTISLSKIPYIYRSQGEKINVLC